MTDNEIIKALECCTKQGCSDNETKECPLKPYEDCSTRLAINALVLINRQKTEIESLQSADVVEIVRCKDCIYYNATHEACNCGKKATSGVGVFSPNADDFCSYGERKENENA